ncbi:hypothetical protein [Pseudotenacibaculum haliotis]|uniref:Uncharacterized protein n=1 Tax=Pseudotenacibaculum haliotis TaxID=1862138 RepID=A0ABW5LY45_9FLAO
MDKEVKELLDSMICLISIDKKHHECFKDTQSVERDISHLVSRRILHWLFLLARGMGEKSYNFNPYKTENKAEAILHPQFKIFFDHYKIINAIFTLTNKGVEWNSSVSQKERDKIINYIDQNYEPIRSI